ncbi:MAG: NAD(P)/FAD-dependent oxidoreductase [Sneathiella sp.]
MQSRSDNTFDAIVIGGGPGGSSCATFLAQAGKKVLLLEKDKFPRYHIGESLLSGTLEIFRKLNVLDELEKIFVKKYGVEWIWGDNKQKWTTYFKDAVSIPYDYGFQVERADFDKILLDNAGRHGVDVREECKVVSPIMDGEKTVGVRYKDLKSGENITVHATWTIDASGQAGMLSKQKQEKKWDPLLKNMAVWSYWKNAKRGEGIDNGNTFLPTFAEGWWWFIPLRDEVTSIGAVVDAGNVEKLKEMGPEAFYLDAISKTPEMAERLKDAEQVDQVRTLKDWSYEHENFYGKGYIAVGDAACFIDPLFSTGVHLALLAGYTSSLVVKTLLDDERADEDKLLEFYQRQYKREYTRYRDQVYFLYAGQAAEKEDYFWKARSIFDQPDLAPKEAFISLIAGSFEHRGWYHRCLKRMGSPEELEDIVTRISNPDQFEQDKGAFAMSSVILADDYAIFDDYAVEDDQLIPIRTMRVQDQFDLPVTPVVDAILEKAGQETLMDDLISALEAQGFEDADIHRSLMDTITYGVLDVRNTAITPTAAPQEAALTAGD